MNRPLTLPPALTRLIDHLATHGVRPILVGGYVRDALLGDESKDIDIECYGVASLEMLEPLLRPFGNVNAVGKSFGVLKLSLQELKIDLALPRLETKTGPGHKGFSVQTDQHLDFKTAARRRDFTINAIGYDPSARQWLDPYGGIDDLSHGRLRCVDSKTFVEDPLRVLRAVQFAARFKLTPDKQLVTLANNMVSDGLLEELPKPRIYEEFRKLLLRSKQPSIGLYTMQKLGLFRFFAAFSQLDNDSLEATACCLDTMAMLKQHIDADPMALMLVALCAAMQERDMVESLLDQLTDEKRLRLEVLHLFDNRDLAERLYKASDVKVMQAARSMRLELVLNLAKCEAKCCDRNIEHAVQWLETTANRLDVLKAARPPLLRGDDLIAAGLKPSKAFKTILEDAYLAQLEGRFDTTNGARKWLKNYLRDLGKS